jgi:branched-chain amino acid transport system permease protein
VTIGLIEPSISAANPESWQLILGGTFIAVVLVAPAGILPALKNAAEHLVRLCGGGTDTSRGSGRSSLLSTGAHSEKGTSEQVLGKITDVGKSYGSLTVLRSISIEFRSSEILCIIGPNGAGKSTLMNAITDPSALEHGDVVLNERLMNGSPPERIARLGVGRTFQGTKLMDTMSVADSLFVAALRGRIPSLWRRSTVVGVPPQVVELARHTELDQVLDVPVAELSHGKRQALELCMAMALQPRLLFLDEPTAGLTDEERSEVGLLLRSLVDEGLAVVLIEHDLEFVRRITDRVAVLHRGELAATGAVEDVAGSNLIREIYLGSATG